MNHAKAAAISYRRREYDGFCFLKSMDLEWLALLGNWDTPDGPQKEFVDISGLGTHGAWQRALASSQNSTNSQIPKHI